MTSIFAFFILICVLVFVHEYGHFWAARKCGVKVFRFSIGFGKVLWKKKDKQGTEFAFSLIPLGGYVQMYNGEPEYGLPAEQALSNKTVLQRAFIVIAGPLANFLFAIVTYWVVFGVGVPTIKPVVGNVLPDSIAAQAKIESEIEITQINGIKVQDWEEVTLALVANVGSKKVELTGKQIDSDFPQTFMLDLTHWDIDGNKQNPLTTLGIRPKSGNIEPIIKAIAENSPAEKAGLKVGDRIVTVNQKPFDWAFLLEQVQTGNEVELVILRDNAKQLFSILPQKSNGRYLIGIQPTYQPLADKYHIDLKYDILTALEKSFDKVFTLMRTILQFIGHLITGELSLSNMGGPISMAKGAGATAEIGIIYYLGFMALISVNLGVMNLFPILPLDGGQLVLLGGEVLRGKPLTEKIQRRFQQIGLALVLSLMIFALFNDIIHF